MPMPAVLGERKPGYLSSEPDGLEGETMFWNMKETLVCRFDTYLAGMVMRFLRPPMTRFLGQPAPCGATNRSSEISLNVR